MSNDIGKVLYGLKKMPDGPGKMYDCVRKVSDGLGKVSGSWEGVR